MKIKEIKKFLLENENKENKENKIFPMRSNFKKGKKMLKK